MIVDAEGVVISCAIHHLIIGKVVAMEVIVVTYLIDLTIYIEQDYLRIGDCDSPLKYLLTVAEDTFLDGLEIEIRTPGIKYKLLLVGVVNADEILVGAIPYVLNVKLLDLLGLGVGESYLHDCLKNGL